MPKIFSKLSKNALKRAVYFILFAVIIISAVCVTCFNSEIVGAGDEKVSFMLWQIDSFEGGKGSRATYLQNLADDYSKENNCYVTVTALSSEAARLNIQNGTIPDIISYGAGIYGIEEIISGGKSFYTWAYGGYCFITLDSSADFNDISDKNTIVNCGTENLSEVAALFCGIENAYFDLPAGAYVKLINGKYKYLLGTQRDIYRFKTRGATFYVKPVTVFNDLYQNISVTTACKNLSRANGLINYIIENGDLTKLGLMGENKIYSDEMSIMEGLEYDYKLISPISLATKEQISEAVKNSDIKTLKTLLI